MGRYGIWGILLAGAALGAFDAMSAVGVKVGIDARFGTECEFEMPIEKNGEGLVLT